MRLQISTDAVPERERFAFWSEAVFSTLAITAQPLPGVHGSFRGRFSARSNGPLLNCSFAGDGFQAIRQRREIAHRQWDSYRVYRESSAGVTFSITGQVLVTAPGDLLIADADAPLEAWPDDGYCDESWLVPKAMMEPHLPVSGRPLLARLSGRGWVETLAASYLDALSRNWDCIPAAAMGQVAEVFSRLVGIACGAAAAAQPDAMRTGRLAQAKQHINDHLAEPALSPASVAGALGISVRALHLLFEPSGTSFARYVLRRRLEECRAALLASPARPVTDIAFAWGFGTLSNFYRAFQAAFGVSPGEVRLAACVDRGC